MRDLELGRLARALRRRRGWRQEDCAVRARVHRSTWSNLERGRLSQMALATLRRCLEVIEVTLDLAPRWRGTHLGRLLDEGHAQLEAAWKERLERWGWLVRVEVSYSYFGERGRVDLVAWYAPLRILLIIEVKTEIVDLQALLGGLDAKRRLGTTIARQLGLGVPARVVPILLVAAGTTNRDRVNRFSALFADFALRGRAAVSWLRDPSADTAGGLLIFSDLRPANGRRVTLRGKDRIRCRTAAPSVGNERVEAPAAVEGA